MAFSLATIYTQQATSSHDALIMFLYYVLISTAEGPL
jgi:hypothetical protein